MGLLDELLECGDVAVGGVVTEEVVLHGVGLA
jgi:hypothetical protein